MPTTLTCHLRRALMLGLALPTLAFAGDGYRSAAQKGLDFLGSDTVRWQKSNNCYGCHVQAVTLEGLAVGKHNQYRVPAAVLEEVLRGITLSPGGSRTPGGLTHGSFPFTAKTFGASAFARYDALVDGKLTDDLLVLAKELMARQQADGSVHGDHQAYPVSTGPMQATFQAAQAWRQAFARTADDVWLAPLRASERFMTAQAEAWLKNVEGVYLQDLNYATMGLLAAGVPPNDKAVAPLLRTLRARQHKDGGWGFTTESDAFATGQTVYTLKAAGMTEQDRVVQQGLGWLAEHQRTGGGWSQSGSGRAEAMWAVLGLVSVDVMSVAISGITDGEHVAPMMPVSVTAKDNQGAEVKQVALIIDDLEVKKAPGGTLAFAWDTRALKSGKHTVDVVATNAKGATSRRRVDVYAGNIFVTQLGTRFTDEGTQVTLRNIGPEGTAASLRLEVVAEEGVSAKKTVYSSTLPAKHGAFAFVFGGNAENGKPYAAGRYRAVVSFIDAKGAALHRESVVFVHDSPELQRARYAEVAGKLDLAKDGSGAANAMVELLDDAGNVVQQAQSNASGQYRFKGVDSGKYKVRVKKDGFRASEAQVEAKAGAPATEKSLSLQ